jgi:hypothetical protein
LSLEQRTKCTKREAVSLVLESIARKGSGATRYQCALRFYPCGIQGCPLYHHQIASSIDFSQRDHIDPKEPPEPLNSILKAATLLPLRHRLSSIPLLTQTCIIIAGWQSLHRTGCKKLTYQHAETPSVALHELPVPFGAKSDRCRISESAPDRE